MSQSQPLRIESPQYSSFCTSRTVNSALWFVNNPELEERILGYLAKYQEKYQVKLNAFTIQGSHYHSMNYFSHCNRAAFYRDFNARIAEAVKALVKNFPGGHLFERRYSEQAVPNPEDIEDRFFYCALQAVSAGLCEYITNYPGYNSFFDAISGRKRKFKIVNWAKYNAMKRYNPNLDIAEFTKVYILQYSRLPGYDHLSQDEYKAIMLEKLEKRRKDIIQDILFKNPKHKFLTKKELRAVIPGTLAKNPKKSSRYDPRPLVLTLCNETKKVFLNWYFSIFDRYKRAVKKYLSGDSLAEFPPGTYKPPGPFVPIISSA